MSKLKTSIEKFPMLALLAPTAVMLLIFFLLIAPYANRQSSVAAAEAMAQAEAQRIDAAIFGRKLQLQAIARDPATLDALTRKDATALAARSEYWGSLFEDAERFALLPYDMLGHAGMGELGQILQNNIERDIVSRSVKERAAVADVYVSGGRWRMLLAAPIVDTATVGVAFIELQPRWLQNLLSARFSAEHSPPEQVLLRVVLERPSREVLATEVLGLSLDDPAAASEAVQHLADVVVETTLPVSNPNNLVLGGLLAATGLLVALLGAMLPRLRVAALRSQLERDNERLAQFVASNAQSAVKMPEFELPEHRELAQSVKASLARFRADSDARGSLEKQVKARVAAVMPDEPETEVAPAPEIAASVELPPAIFRAYDIRGHAETELSDEVARVLGQAFGSQLIESGESSVALAYDSRLSSPRLAEQVSRGLQDAGCAVVDLGLVPTPLMYFAAQRQAGGNGVMVTGSHNPAEQNGFKLMQGGAALVDDQLQQLYRRASAGDLLSGDGSRSDYDCIDDYVDVLADDVVFAAPMKIVIDCCNGAASQVAPILYASLGAEVVPLFAEPDGNFPNHPPNPTAENLQALFKEVVEQGADLGLAFDGDGDRVFAVTAEGHLLQSDQLLMLFAKDVLTRNPGADVVFDVKCSRSLNQLIAGFGGRPVVWKSGHSRIKQKMRETGALLGGEFSGHFCFAERWFGFDDGLYAGARLIELLTLESRSLQDAVAELPVSYSTDEILIPIDEASKFDAIAKLAGTAQFNDAEINDIDGLRAEFSDGWGLLRASNTSPALTARFEADSQEALERIVALFAAALGEVDPALQLTI